MSLNFLDKQHIVFGAGLIGCYLGGVLTKLGGRVSLVCRPSITTKLKSGIRLTDFEHNQGNVEHINVVDSEQVLTDSQPRTKADLLWLTVKCTGVEQAVIDIAPWVDKHTIIFCCQNGLGSDAAVKLAYPDNLVLRVMVPFNVVEMTEGHYHRGSEGRMTIEYNNDCSDLVSTLISQLNCPLLPIKATNNMQALLWAKLQLNLGNSINALADIPVKAMLEQRAYRKVIALLMMELLWVADGLGIKLPKVTALPAPMIPRVLCLPNFIFTRLANKMLEIDPNVRSSMWWDVSQNKPTEISHINGAILQHAKKLNIVCPANEKVITLISQLSSGVSFTEEQKPPIAAKTLLAWVSQNK